MKPCRGREPGLQELEKELGDFVWVLPLTATCCASKGERAGLQEGLEASPGCSREAFTYGLEWARSDAARESGRFDALL